MAAILEKVISRVHILNRTGYSLIALCGHVLFGDNLGPSGGKRNVQVMKPRYSRREFVRKTSLAPLELSALAWLSKSSMGEPAPSAGETLWQSFVKPPDDARI